MLNNLFSMSFFLVNNSKQHLANYLTRSVKIQRGAENYLLIINDVQLIALSNLYYK